MRSTNRRPIAGSAVAIVIVSAAFGWQMVARDSGAQPVMSRLPSDLFAGPFPGGRQVSMREALHTATYPVLVPDSADADPTDLTKVWVDNDGDIGFQYSSNITVMMWPSAYTDPAAGMQNVLATTTARASLIEVDGSPGISLFPRTAANANPAWVEFVRAGVDINIYSSTRTVDDLVAVADSMIQAKTQTSR